MKTNNLKTKNIAPINTLSIRGQWASRFANRIELIDKSKNERLKIMKCSTKHRNFPVQNDVVLDKIKSIKKIQIQTQKKVLKNLTGLLPGAVYKVWIDGDIKNLCMLRYLFGHIIDCVNYCNDIWTEKLKTKKSKR